jgi:hypothetical protein
MAQRASQKPVVQFNKGLVTEAGELTFPEGASVDELNCSLERDGSRRRRLGIAYESNYVLTPSASVADGTTTSVSVWENAGTVAGLNFVVVQLGSTLHFYEEGATLSANKKSFTVDLVTYERPNAVSSANATVQTASIQGKLIVASPEINTFVVDYDEGTDGISVNEIKFRIRDFEWQGDVSTYTEELGTGSVTDAREYDTMNTGWKGDKGTAALAAYDTANTSYPALTLPWYSGKNSSGDFSVTEWEKIFAGTSLIANGSYTYDLYNMDRQTSSGLSGVDNYVENSRFATVVAYAGRMWYAGMGNKNTSNIFFSKLIQQDNDFGECLQVNDPTAETISDLLDTDGGYVNIPDAYNIRRLHVLGSQLIVFAENGVWVIKGLDNIFTPTGYSVSKIAENGLSYEGSFVAEEGSRPYWWSSSGIHTLTVSAEQQTLQEVNLSLPTIQGFYNKISASKRGQVVAAYDAFNSRVGWFYPDNDETTDYKLNNVLWLDEQLQAFYPWHVSDATVGQHMLVPFYTRGKGTTSVDLTVTDNAGNEVVDSSGNTVIVTRAGREYFSSALQVLVRDASGQIAFAQFTSPSFTDWGSADYESFVEGGYDFMGDLTLRKGLIYLTSYLKVTESDIIGDDVLGYQFTRPSSCKVSTYWDFRTTSSQKPQEAYRLKKLPVPDGAGNLAYPNTVTTSRLRLKGRGRSMRFRFDSTSGHDFHLLGFDRIGGINPR